MTFNRYDGTIDTDYVALQKKQGSSIFSPFFCSLNKEVTEICIIGTVIAAVQG